MGRLQLVNVPSCAAVAFVITLLAIVVLRPVAYSLQLVDRPGGRKTHEGVVPLVGGLAMFIGLVAALGFVNPSPPEVAPLLGVFALMVLMGMVDDRFSISHWMRLGVHLVAGVVLVANTGAIVHTMGDPFGTGMIWLTAAGGLVFTLAMIAAAVNSFNMLDGMDGLAGIVSLISLGGLAGIAALAGHGRGVEVTVCAVLGASTIAFLVFNVPVSANRHIRCFMGDAGSTLTGVAIAWLCVRISQMPLRGAAHPVTVLWMVALPVYELFWTVIRRALRGQSPMRADAGHFHHVLTQSGLNVRAAFLLFLLLDAALVGVGFLLNALAVPDWVSLALLAVGGVLVVRAMHGVYRIVAWLPEAARHHHPNSGETQGA
jgi:UDP-GlcNAc:undecaprenyl-phosphate/decaprenyl-phosphate GlcNAc-1-phosphate transferase